jgi:hypothetical protein
VLEELGDPLRVTHVRLAARDGLDVGGVEQPRRHAFLEAVEDRLPVRRGRLHRRQGDPALHEPVRHHPQRAGHRRERARLRHPPARGAWGAHADHDDLLADVQTCDPLDQHVHRDHLRELDTRGVARRGSRDRRQTRVLEATMRHTPSPRVELFCGLDRTRVSRRRQAAPPFSSHRPNGQTVPTTLLAR